MVNQTYSGLHPSHGGNYLTRESAPLPLRPLPLRFLSLFLLELLPRKPHPVAPVSQRMAFRIARGKVDRKAGPRTDQSPHRHQFTTTNTATTAGAHPNTVT